MPPRYKQALVVWLAIYPTITLLQLTFGSTLAQLPIPLRTLVLTGVLVPLMVFVLVPTLNRLLARWLKPAGEASAPTPPPPSRPPPPTTAP